MIWVILFIGLASTLAISDPFSIFPSNFNHALLQAIPPRVGILILTLPIIAFFGLNVMEKCYFVELEKKDERLKDLKMREQTLLFLARYRSKGKTTVWEITNRSVFPWNNAKFFIERDIDGEKLTEKQQLKHIEPMKRITLTSKLAALPGAQWRVMILAEEGFLVDVPERLANLDFES